MMDKFDIFISYRRNGGFETAKHLNDLLIRDGFTVSFDIDTLREGDFDDTLLKRIDQCSDFLLIVDKHTFDRTLDSTFSPKKDWVRRELSYALKLRKNVIPILLSGVDEFPENLPEDISGVITKNGPQYNKYYFDEFYERLKTFLHSKPRNKSYQFWSSRIFKACLIVLFLFVIITTIVFVGTNTNLFNRSKSVENITFVNPVMGEYNYSGFVDEGGKPHGKGVAKFAQGDIYEGNFEHGNFEGECTYINSAEGHKFVGTYKNNQRYYGTYLWEDGTYFTGSYKDNEIYRGILYDINGNKIEDY